MFSRRLAVTRLFFLSAVLLPASTMWMETGPAGDLPATAEVVTGTAPLTAIIGSLDLLDEVDMYVINIVDPLGFSASTASVIGLVPDPKLFLFSYSGAGVYMNDDMGGSNAMLPAGHPLGPISAGLYLLAIARFDNSPLGASGPIFSAGSTVNGPAGSDIVTGWDRNVQGHIDFDALYRIDLTGAAPVSTIPEPMSLSLVAGAVIAGLALRRRCVQ